MAIADTLVATPPPLRLDSNGTLYVGVTSDIARRPWEHREGVVEGFTERYHLKRLVCVEHHDEIQSAIQREKNIKHANNR